MRPDGPRPTIVGNSDGPEPPYPLKLDGKVIKGFGRGSKDLGIPTANIPLSGLSVGGHEDLESGVYYGWAGLSPSQAIEQQQSSGSSQYKLMKTEVFDKLSSMLADAATPAPTQGAVYPMVMSIGWNPFYKNTVRSVEVHIMQDFQTDFYDSHMNLLIVGFIRPELDYVSKESLIDDIKTDIDVAGRSLSRPAYIALAKDSYLSSFEDKGEIAS
ncbi:putative riboflavin kinase domain, bacterial/, riboflavin kinase domain superfamily [Septoria linicola]|nr:putative riboflavin kinase domain, bacterial/, riboflavin kinase domain superfamily [Septoria linicola]